MTWTNLSPTSLKATGETIDNGVSGHFSIETSDNSAKITLSHFPLALIDYAIAHQYPQLAGIPRIALGDTLDLTVEQTESSGIKNVTLNAASTNLAITLNGTVDNDIFTLAEPAKTKLTVTPELISLLMNLRKMESPILLVRPTQMEIAINQLKIPLDQQRHLEGDLQLQAQLKVDQADLVSVSIPGPIVLKQVVANIEAPQTSQAVKVELSGIAIHNDHPMPLQLHATFEKPAQLNQLIDSIRKTLGIEAQLQTIPFVLIDQLMATQHFQRC